MQTCKKYSGKSKRWQRKQRIESVKNAVRLLCPTGAKIKQAYEIELRSDAHNNPLF